MCDIDPAARSFLSFSFYKDLCCSAASETEKGLWLIYYYLSFLFHSQPKGFFPRRRLNKAEKLGLAGRREGKQTNNRLN